MASVSKPRPKRFQILKRKPRARLFDWGLDKQWIWAAYKNGDGGFGDDFFEKALSIDDFLNVAERVLAAIDYPYLMEGEVRGKGVVPVGFAEIRIVQKHVEPHFHWFWWSTPRNRYEASFKFFDKLAEDAPFVIAVELDKEAFRMAEHLKSAGLMRRVGTSRNWEPNKIMALYETRDG